MKDLDGQGKAASGKLSKPCLINHSNDSNYAKNENNWTGYLVHPPELLEPELMAEKVYQAAKGKPPQACP